MKPIPRLIFVIVLALCSSRATAADTKGASPGDKPASQPEPPEAFRSFVRNVRISGVFDGTTRRIYVDKRVINIGDAVNAALGIGLHSVDVDARVIVFEDGSGARVAKSYPR